MKYQICAAPQNVYCRLNPFNIRFRKNRPG
uniref:Uncharacterized protein n=1 Tax=Anguilla anguilla TaxID=7936 RepID=A0A0E9RR07_ANGAN